MAIVNPGELRDIIVVCEAIKVKEMGITTYKYNTISRVRAKVKTDKNSLFRDSDTRKRKKMLRIVCHKRDFLEEDNFILYEGKYYRIICVNELDDHLYVQVFAELVE